MDSLQPNSVSPKLDASIYYRSDQEERLNFTTHALGFVLAMLGLYFLIPAMSGKSQFVQLVTWIYGATMVLLYASSALSHRYHRSSFRSLFRKLDQAFIFIFIVAGFTPYFAVHLTETWAWVGVSFLWLFAIIGFCSKLFLGHRIEGIATWTYLALGWIPVMAMPFAKSIPLQAQGFIFAGGICYMVGIGFLLTDRRNKYFHSIWHLFVIAGTGVHYWGIQNCLAAPSLLQ